MAWSDAARRAAAEARRLRAKGKPWRGVFKQLRGGYGKYTVWGLPKGETDRLHEQILSTQSRGPAHIEKIKKAASSDGWHSFRVTKADGSKPDFLGAIRRARRGK